MQTSSPVGACNWELDTHSNYNKNEYKKGGSTESPFFCPVYNLSILLIVTMQPFYSFAFL
jgi:hypothetical protein